MKEQQARFLKEDFIPMLEKLDPGARGKWGVMKGQEMVEHYTNSVRIASGRLKFPQVNEGVILEKSRAFLAGDREFRENTKNPLLGDAPPPLTNPDMSSAIAELRNELDFFFSRFDQEPALMTHNPIFGDLDYGMNLQFLSKHARHHLKQFGLLS
jgi:hypothetical protein